MADCAQPRFFDLTELNADDARELHARVNATLSKVNAMADFMAKADIRAPSKPHQTAAGMRGSYTAAPEGRFITAITKARSSDFNEQMEGKALLDEADARYLAQEEALGWAKS